MIMSIKKYRTLIIILLSIFIIWMIIYILSNSMLFLPKGILIESRNSPNGVYIMNAYKIDGGPISADAIRVEIINKKKNKKKNIYWCYPKSEVSIKWLNDETVEINEIKLNIKKEKYNNN